MDFAKLKKRFQRELQTNPKKAAILGLLTLVALWFWAPLVWNWCAAKSSGKNVAEQKPASADVATTPAAAKETHSATNNTIAAGTTMPWRELARLIENDPLMRPVRKIAILRSPFELPEKPQQPTDEEEEETKTAALPIATPQSVGLVLTSTIVGSQRRVAMIGGKAYAEGRTIRVERSDSTISFKLVEVKPRSVVLLGESGLFELKLSKGIAAVDRQDSAEED